MARTKERPLGNRPPTDDRHERKYPWRAVAREVAALTPEQVDEILRRGVSSDLPYWHWLHDQGFIQGSCVGHASAMERAISNGAQAQASGVKPFNRRYDPIAPWRLAKGRDEWDDTTPDDDDGTSARAVYEVYQEVGASRIRATYFGQDGRVEVKGAKPADPAEGVETFRWALNVDEMREALAGGVPAITIGTPWYTAFDRNLVKKPSGYYLPMPDQDWGTMRGYHETCVYGAHDGRAAFRMKNSWGKDFPLVWIPYETMERMFGEWADAVLVVDR